MPRRQIALLLILLSFALTHIAATAAGDDGSTGEPSDKSGIRLKGTVDDAGQMQPSVKLLKTQAPGLVPASTSVTQFAGKGTYIPGSPAPKAPPLPRPAKKIQKPKVVAPVETEESYEPVRPPAHVPSALLPRKALPPPPKWNFTLTPRKGIMTWEPGHDIKVITPPRIKTSASAQLRRMETTATRYSATARTATPQIRPLSAVPLQLPTVRSATGQAASSWEEWYRRVANTIYQQWQHADTSAGQAVVRVTVFRSHDVDCQVREFNPAADIARNAAKETHFRESAIRCIYNLNKGQILDFPYGARQNKVLFDMQFRRGVGGPAGCELTQITTK